jgi:hypothetical protein
MIGMGEVKPKDGKHRRKFEPEFENDADRLVGHSKPICQAGGRRVRHF